MKTFLLGVVAKTESATKAGDFEYRFANRIMSVSRLAVLGALFVASTGFVAGCASDATSEEEGSTESEVARPNSMLALLGSVPAGTPWHKVDRSVRERLEQKADATFKNVRTAWGRNGLEQKEERLLKSPTPKMTENFDRVIKFMLTPELPEAFIPSKDVKNAQLLKQLKRLYLVNAAEQRGNLRSSNPEFKDWDGSDITEFPIADVEALEDQKAYAKNVEAKLKAISPSALTDVEKAMVYKATFYARQLKYGSLGGNLGGNDSRVTGVASWPLYSAVTSYPTTSETHVFKNDEEFLLAINALTFQRLLYTNVGTVDAFNSDIVTEVDPALLTDNGLDPATSAAGKGYLALAGWWKERLNASPEAKKSCTIYTKAQRAEIWDAHTADNFSNADGHETIEGYAQSSKAIATQRSAYNKDVAVSMIEAFFRSPSPLLTATQKTKVLAAAQAETKPAALLDTIYAALDKETGNTAASDALKAEFAALTTVGGNYNPGDSVRRADLATINAMWEDVKSFFARHYAGYPVNLAANLPATLRVTTDDGIFASREEIVAGLASAKDKVTLYSTLLHEGKHAIDWRSGASVQGAAWEGAALVAERTLLKPMVEEVMAAEKDRLPMYLLSQSMYYMLGTSTTEATINLLLRDSCGPREPNSIDFVKSFGRAFGFKDEETLAYSSTRAHSGVQYLSYEYGAVIYSDLVTWLQQQVGPTAVPVDPYVLQACGMPSPNRDAAAVTKLKACLGVR